MIRSALCSKTAAWLTGLAAGIGSLGAIGSISSCAKATEEDLLILRWPMDSAMVLDLWESVETGLPALEWQLTSDKIGSSSMGIELEQHRSGNHWTAKVKGIIAPVLMSQDLVNITSTHNWGTVVPGAYSVLVDVEGDPHVLKLSVTKQQYALSLQSGDRIRIGRGVLKRMQKDVLFGYVSYSDSGKTPVIEQALSELQDIGVAPYAIPKGDYGYFVVGADGQAVDSPDDYLRGSKTYGIPFVLAIEKDASVYMDRLETLFADHGASMTITAYAYQEKALERRTWQ